MKKGTKLSDLVVLRRRGLELHQQGWTQLRIAEALGVSQPTVSGWIQDYRERGAISLDYPTTGGSQRRLTEAQMDKLKELIRGGACAQGYADEFWTAERVRELIERTFGVVYQRRAVSDLLHHLGFTPQKPARHSHKQDAEAVRQWYEERLPAVEKKPTKKDT